MDKETEDRLYRDEHRRIHGHDPIPDLSGRRMCAHPAHDALQQIMTQPGIVLEFPFDPREVMTVDDPSVMAYEQDYRDQVSFWKDKIADIEEREAFIDAGKPKKVY